MAPSLTFILYFLLALDYKRRVPAIGELFFLVLSSPE